MRNCLIDFKEIRDARGALISLENNKNIPFEIKRVYYLYDLNKEPRGFHAHKKLKQILICLSGSCEVLLDDGVEKKIFFLNNPAQGLLVSEMVWREMSNFSEGCVLMVLASEYYDEADYFRKYEDFLLSTKNSNHCLERGGYEAFGYFIGREFVKPRGLRKNEGNEA